MTEFHHAVIPWYILGLIFGTLLMMEWGYRYGVREKRDHPELADSASGAIEASIFALLGLLLAFTFSAAQSRFETRRQLIIQEANDIGTAYLRLDLLPKAAQVELRQRFREYIDSRLAVYRAIPDMDLVNQKLKISQSLQQKIWDESVAALQEGNPSAAVVLLPALNNMIDITAARTAMAKAHTPGVIFILLFVIALLSSAVAGYGMAKSPGRNWFHRLAFVLIVSSTVYVITDLEYPRRGLIRFDATDQLLIDLHESMR